MVLVLRMIFVCRILCINLSCQRQDVKALVERAIGLGVLTSLNGAKANASALALVRASRMLLVGGYDINMKAWQIGQAYELIRF